MVILHGICNGYINTYNYNDIVTKNCCSSHKWCNCVNGVMNAVGGYTCKNYDKEESNGLY